MKKQKGSKPRAHSNNNYNAKVWDVEAKKGKEGVALYKKELEMNAKLRAKKSGKNDFTMDE